MPEYLLPCSCGQKVPVSARHAGQTVRCTCGTELDVPTLRGLRELETAGSPTTSTSRTWGNHQRIVFLLAVASLVAFAVAGFLALRTPPQIEPPPETEINQETPMILVFAAYDDFKQGLDTDPPVQKLYERELAQQRAMFMWGVRIALAVGGIGAVAAVAVLLSGKSEKR